MSAYGPKADITSRWTMRALFAQARRPFLAPGLTANAASQASISILTNVCRVGRNSNLAHHNSTGHLHNSKDHHRNSRDHNRKSNMVHIRSTMVHNRNSRVLMRCSLPEQDRQRQLRGSTSHHANELRLCWVRQPP